MGGSAVEFAALYCVTYHHHKLQRPSVMAGTGMGHVRLTASYPRRTSLHQNADLGAEVLGPLRQRWGMW